LAETGYRPESWLEFGVFRTISVLVSDHFATLFPPVHRNGPIWRIPAGKLVYMIATAPEQFPRHLAKQLETEAIERHTV